MVDFRRTARHAAHVPFYEFLPAAVRPRDDQQGGGLLIGIDDSALETGVGIHPREDGTFERIDRSRAEFTTGSQFSDYIDVVKDIASDFGGRVRARSRPAGLPPRPNGEDRVPTEIDRAPTVADG